MNSIHTIFPYNTFKHKFATQLFYVFTHNLFIIRLVLNTHIHRSFFLIFHNFHLSSQAKNMKFIHWIKTQFTNLINTIHIYHIYIFAEWHNLVISIILIFFLIKSLCSKITVKSNTIILFISIIIDTLTHIKDIQQINIQYDFNNFFISSHYGQLYI
jgi:hypothetical protein